MIEASWKAVAEDEDAPMEVVTVPTASVRAGDVLRVLPGERVPVDGEVLHGRCSVDESMLTGEAALVAKAQGAAVSCFEPPAVLSAHAAPALCKMFECTFVNLTGPIIETPVMQGRVQRWFVRETFTECAGAP